MRQRCIKKHTHKNATDQHSVIWLLVKIFYDCNAHLSGIGFFLLFLKLSASMRTFTDKYFCSLMHKSNETKSMQFVASLTENFTNEHPIRGSDSYWKSCSKIKMIAIVFDVQYSISFHSVAIVSLWIICSFTAAKTLKMVWAVSISRKRRIPKKTQTNRLEMRRFAITNCQGINTLLSALIKTFV